MKIVSSMTVGIVGGRGRTGRQFARLFKQAGFRVSVTSKTDAHRNPALIRGCDVIVFSLPLSQAAERMAELSVHAVRKDQLVLDLSSLKERETEAMAKFPGEVIGMHPLFGPSTDPKGERVILCPVRNKPATLRSLKAFFAEAGVQTAVMNPEQHDRLMATVQGVPHLKSFFIADVLRLDGADLEKTLALCTPMYEHEFNVVGRFLDDHPDLYMPIIFRNRRTLKTLKDMRHIIDAYIDIAERQDFAAAEARYAACQRHFKPFLRRARTRSELCIRALLTSSR